MPHTQEIVSLVKQMLDGYALHEIIRDENGKVVDYRFVDVNKAFCELTGLQEDVIGRTVREVLPDIEDHWLERYGQVVTTGEAARFVGYSGPLNKYFEVAAYRPQTGMFATMFHDITAEMRAKEAIEAALEGTITMMGHVCEVRDPYTAGHQRRVASLARRIAQRMGLTPERTKAVYLGALVHDVGKVAVPVEILNFPGRLSEHQYALVKIHPQVGHDILTKIDFPWPVAEIVLQHQERMDGSGYPKGLKGEEIMLETRIVTVADVFEAMSCHRPYREPHSADAAVAELRKNAGRLYDAEAVRTCLALVGAGDIDFETDCPQDRGGVVEELGR